MEAFNEYLKIPASKTMRLTLRRMANILLIRFGVIDQPKVSECREEDGVLILKGSSQDSATSPNTVLINSVMSEPPEDIKCSYNDQFKYSDRADIQQLRLGYFSLTDIEGGSWVDHDYREEQ